ncbi:MAG: DegT/DnrJ/EryC1/StrS family aminotransferase [Candidatus Omnitrophica bacterium]|nr:DegT/DnrJ/EryC1/StrS family aminotransferase [Candidatus Omnitrophota bacterium]
MIYVNDVKFGKKELELVGRCVKTGWISSEGSFVKEFEEAFSGFCGVKYGVACMNGTSAIHLGLLSLGIAKQDEVIIPAFTMIATAYAVIYTGAKPVLVDAEPRTWNMDTAQIRGKITKKTKAILPVHIYGHPVDMEPIWKIKKEKKIDILEDAAEAHGAEYKGIKAGALGDAAAFSFYANKIVTTGEGGMVVTNNKRIALAARYFRNMAFQKKVRYLHKDIGFNYRMTNLQAAVGLAQVSKIESLIDKKRRIARIYNERLKNIEGIEIPREEKWAKNVYWMYGVLIDEKVFGLSRDKVREKLYGEGVDTRSFFVPMHKQPVFRKMGLFLKEKYPVAEDISRRGLYLPSGLTLDEKKIDFISDKLKKIKKRYA